MLLEVGVRQLADLLGRGMEPVGVRRLLLPLEPDQQRVAIADARRELLHRMALPPTALDAFEGVTFDDGHGAVDVALETVRGLDFVRRQRGNEERAAD